MHSKTHNIRTFKIAFMWLLTLFIAVCIYVYFDCISSFVREHQILGWLLTYILLPACATILGGLPFAISRRVRPAKPPADFFGEKALLKLPENKQRYSDRMAYLFAELSDLAYYEVETSESKLKKFADMALQAEKAPEKTTALKNMMEFYEKSTHAGNTEAASDHRLRHLRKTLNDAGFTLCGDYLNNGSAQGFICVYRDDHDGAERRPKPFIAIAFRGSEKKVEDWLTNADAVPSEKVLNSGNGKVHRGFYEDFMGLKAQIEATLADIAEEYRKELPIFITGHSLGGAVATIATREFCPDHAGACYTFGAPRVGDYDYFHRVKTPVYRIVNSSDIVPRVPPGAIAHVFILLLNLLRWVCARFPTIIKAFDAAEGFINKIKDYRHFGDLRYLTDVSADNIGTVELLRNPNYLDVFQWFWRHIFVSYGMPVKSHSMSLYRRKLATVGLARLK